MREETGPTEAAQKYAAARAAHHKTKDLREALVLYRDIMAAHPNTPEAEYSRSHIQHIVHAVVPKHELFDAQLDLALAHVEHQEPLKAEPDPIPTLDSELPGWQKWPR
jgi:hypothetical protein